MRYIPSDIRNVFMLLQLLCQTPEHLFVDCHKRMVWITILEACNLYLETINIRLHLFLHLLAVCHRIVDIQQFTVSGSV